MTGVAHKNSENLQFGRVSKLDGNRSFSSNPDNGSEPLTDNNGRLIVRLADGAGFLDDGSLSTFLNSGNYVEKYHYNAAAAITVNTFYLELLYGYNINAAVRFLQIFQGTANAMAAPVLGAVPTISILVPTMTSFSLQPGNEPIAITPIGDNFANFWIVSSTTGNTYTPSGTNDFWLNLVGRNIIR